MPGRDEPLGILGRPVGECKIVQNRKSQTVVHQFEHGWSLVAARVGAKPKAKFHAIIQRCGLPQCQRQGCLGHDESVTRLAEKIRSTYA